MTALAKKLFTPVQLASSVAAYYTSPASTTTVIKKLVFTNTDSTAHTVTVYLVTSGDAAANSNTLVKAVPVAPGDTYECFESEGMVLAAGDSLQAFADAGTAVTIQASGVQII